mmetsp:Transcript_6066/g.22939  ORF Transcript_6066/g.22939 Transcript_6066/m.22939 type:complete len:93 (-) Transcript_6066:211-489(-)
MYLLWGVCGHGEKMGFARRSRDGKMEWKLNQNNLLAIDYGGDGSQWSKAFSCQQHESDTAETATANSTVSGITKQLSLPTEIQELSIPPKNE